MKTKRDSITFGTLIAAFAFLVAMPTSFSLSVAAESVPGCTLILGLVLYKSQNRQAGYGVSAGPPTAMVNHLKDPMAYVRLAPHFVCQQWGFHN